MWNEQTVWIIQVEHISHKFKRGNMLFKNSVTVDRE